ncbi:hypothetical protein NVP1162O_52 [Vibrio phage 1.162.O._10N.261.48.E3]|nr:hypothetical protein NVP1147O_52 [Vibrio phage 1.147.O._10N.286.49.E9]AUR91722.1 hypothetical protein NVP1162O_52 [Vibrio phage 1.162.O._10N.261.48.E3]
MLDYGLEGYGLYWYCIELIAGKVDKDNITFELEHDARIIARNSGSTAQKVEEMMKYFVDIGLFECSGNTITCLKLAKRLDKSMTSNPQMRGIIENLKSHDSVMIESEKVMQDKIRLDKNRIEENKDSMSANADAIAILTYLNEVFSSKYKHSTKSHIENINARLAEGHSIEDCKLVIDSKFAEWGSDPKMAQYLRPQTIFQTGKFQGYLMSAKTKPVKSKHDLSSIEYTSGSF